MRTTAMVTLKLEDGRTIEVEEKNLVPWSSDWQTDKSYYHLDYFGPRPPHPVTGAPWKGGEPDFLKAVKMLMEEAKKSDSGGS